MVMSAVSTPMKARLADPGLRRAVEAAVRRRVRGDEAEDVVQATFTDVLAAPRLPEDDEEFRRFVFGVARNKVFDHFRRQKRNPEALAEDDAEGGEQPLSARDILRWAEGELPDSESRDTLQWMLREGDGEKLEHIARDARVPAPRVRKRVSRLRKFLRERWAAELMLAGLLVLFGALGALYYFELGRNPDDVVKREPPRPVPSAPRTPLPRTEPAPSLPAGDVPTLAPQASPSASPSASATPRLDAPRKVLAPAKPTPRIDSNFSPKAGPRPTATPQSKKASSLEQLDFGTPPQGTPAPSKPQNKGDATLLDRKDQK